ncbi:MAG: nucleotidyltransferase family protein [Planctomycetes bacterium]|nr:nucleotidyltransferase family protein [Planctomycetota bacterium]
MSEVAPPTHNDAPDSARQGEGVRNLASSEIDRSHKQPTAPSLLGPLSATGLGNARMMLLLERIAAKFNDVDVPLIVLKGGALNLTVYERLHQRPMDDLDLLIRPEDVDRALGLIEELGGQRGESQVRGDFFPRFHYETEYTIGSIHPVKIDLHVRPFRPLRYARLVPEDALWSRAESVAIGGARILVPSPDDMLLHLATHAAVHGFAEKKWLVDIKRWVDAHHTDMDWDRLLTTVRRWHLALPARETFQRVEKELGPVYPPRVSRRLSQMRVCWRDRLVLRQAPRDAAHPAMHVAVNVISTPGPLFVFSYLWAVAIPGRAHMADWYCHRHRGWLPWAHVLRWLWPIVGRFQRLWTRFTKIETRKSPAHGIGVFATRDIEPGEVIARYHGREVERVGMYVVPHKTSTGETRRFELTGKLKFLNHSCRPSAELSGFELVARRAIGEGQEIKINYGEGTCNCEQRETNPTTAAAEPVAEVA